MARNREDMLTNPECFSGAEGLGGFSFVVSDGTEEDVAVGEGTCTRGAGC